MCKKQLSCIFFIETKKHRFHHSMRSDDAEDDIFSRTNVIYTRMSLKNSKYLLLTTETISRRLG